MGKDQILSKLIPILSKQLHVEEEKISEASLLMNDLGADSLDTAEIAMIIQEEFDYNLKDEEIQSIKTVEDIVKILETEKTTKSQ